MATGAATDLSRDTLLPTGDRDVLLSDFAGGMLDFRPRAYEGDLTQYGFGPQFDWFGPPQEQATPEAPAGPDMAGMLSMMFPHVVGPGGELAPGMFRGAGPDAVSRNFIEQAQTGQSTNPWVMANMDEDQRRQAALRRLYQMQMAAMAGGGGMFGGFGGESNAGPGLGSPGIGTTAGAGMGGPAGMGF